jgi:hypothetical protein
MPPGCPNSGVPFGAPVSTHQARRGLAVGKWYRQALVVMCRCALYIPSGVPRCDGMVREVSQSPYALTLTLTPTPTLTLLEQRSVANPQAVRRWARPPCRHIKIQSCCCLGSVRGEDQNPNLGHNPGGCCCRPLQGARALLYMPLAVIIGSRCPRLRRGVRQGGVD